VVRYLVLAGEDAIQFQRIAKQAADASVLQHCAYHRLAEQQALQLSMLLLKRPVRQSRLHEGLRCGSDGADPLTVYVGNQHPASPLLRRPSVRQDLYNVPKIYPYCP
jgi:hypothetical protein